MDANSLAQNVVPGRFNSLTVRFVSLVVILQTIHARAHLVQPRDFDFNNDFGFGTESLGVDLRYTPSEDAVNLADAFTSGSVEGVSLTDPNINLAFASDSGLNADEFSTEQLDLANIISADITFTPPDIAANVFAVEPQNSAIGSDVSITNLGLSDGDLIASVNLFFDFTVIAGVLSGSKNIASFIFNFGIQNILNAADNFSFSLSSSAFFIDSASSSSASSLDNVEIKNVGFVAPSKNSEPFTFSSEFEKIFNAAEIKPTFSTSDTSIVIDSDFGVSASSPEKLQIADVEFVAPSESDNKIALSPGAEDFLKPAKKPFSGSSKTFVSPIEKTPFGVGVNPATLSEGDLNLSTFKAGTETLATDVKLPPKMQEYFDRVTKAPLTQNDWKIISEDLNLGGNSQAPISTTNSQRLLQANSGFDLGGIASNFVKALITIQKAVIQNSDTVVTQRVPVPIPVTQRVPAPIPVTQRVGVPVPVTLRVGVPVPVTVTVVGGVRAPITVISTLSDGVTKVVVPLSPLNATPSTLVTFPSQSASASTAPISPPTSSLLIA